MRNVSKTYLTRLPLWWDYLGIDMAKLKQADKLEIKVLYAMRGWRPMHIARKFDIAHSTVLYHVHGIKREVEPIDYCPEEIVDKSSHVRSWKRNRPIDFKTYEDYLEEDERRRVRKRHACMHDRIAIICLCCGQHFEETKNQKAKAKVTFYENTND